MLNIKWNSSGGWDVPVVQPYGPLTLEPSAVVFHYAMEVSTSLVLFFLNTSFYSPPSFFLSVSRV